MDEELILTKRLEDLKSQHKALDHAIDMLDARADPFAYQRLKRDRLALRDSIKRIELELYPDIVA